MTLPELSAAATQGTLIHHGWGDGSTLGGMTNIFNEDAEVLLMECIPEADAAFIVALWNAYRTGQLVERDGVDLVGANTLPTEYVRWLSSIEVDVRVHDLTADEVARLYRTKKVSDGRNDIWDELINPDGPEAATAIIALQTALNNVMVGGNHLALLIGSDHPPYTAEPLDALEHYGPCDQYEIWCCWRAIMLARTTLAKARGKA